MKRTNSIQLLAAAVLALGLVPPNACAAAGDLYLADSSNAAIFTYTPDGTRSTFASGLRQPVAMAFDSRGNLFIADSGSGTVQTESTIFKFASDGTKSTFADLGLTTPLSMAFDGVGNLFVSNSLDILKFSPDGARSTFVSNVNGVWALAFDRFGNLYAAINASGANSIMKFTPDGSSSTFISFSGPGQSITVMAFGTSGDLFAQRGDAILKITPAGDQNAFASGDFHSALAFDTGGILFAGIPAFNSSEAAIVKFTPTGTRTTFAFGPLFPAALAFEPVTEKLRNISARGLVGTGDEVLIGGFIVGGNALANNSVVARAIGPSLSEARVSDPLQNPVIELHNASGAIIATNDNWQDTQKDQIIASGLAPSDPNESAIFATLPAGNYTAVVLGAGDTTGVALVEVYSVNQ